MKKIIFILFAILIFNSCSVLYGPNMEKRAQNLELGMSKQEVINIMGKDYYVESVSEVPEGKLEILHFRSLYYPEYLVYLLDGNLTEFHRYIYPTPLHIIKEEVK